MTRRSKSRARGDASQRRSRRKTRSEPQRIDGVLSGLMARRGYGQLQQTAELESAWRAAVTGQLADVSRPTQVRRGVLEVVVENSAAIQELMFQKNEILEKLTQAIPDQQIKGLRFRNGVI